MRTVKAANLKPGMILALPFGKTATIQSVQRGTKYMNFITEHGPSRVDIDSTHLVEETGMFVVFNEEELDCLIFACEDIGEVYRDDDEDRAVSAIGHVLMYKVLPKLVNAKERNK